MTYEANSKRPRSGSVSNHWQHAMIDDFSLLALEKMTRSFPNAAHPNWVARFTSFSKLLEYIIGKPKLSDVLAVDVDAKPVLIQKLKNVL
ncbi:jg24704 [Pararge aegeria aegeria]|uniref:Jg24704 protein n=1 Tax=Pararge aegeria aegeria TaxID=348720 RepID=A0A8S4QJX7_9NEOP|nr:jg24704 [Pararge aegeria aegeria]